MLSMMKDLTDKDCVIVLLTGGGSALMESLPSHITLADMQELSKVLLGCGATIHEINCIRKHISQVKGGQLARLISQHGTLPALLNLAAATPVQTSVFGSKASRTSFSRRASECR